MTTTHTRSAASRAQSDYARSAVFAAFRGRDAKAIDQGDFVDRRPDHVVRTCAPPTRTVAELALDRLAEVLRQVGGEAGLQP